MEDKFKIEPLNDSVIIKYIGHNPSSSLNIWLDSWVVLNSNDVDTVINATLEFEKTVDVILKERNLKYETSRVIAELFVSIEAWTCSISVLNKLSKKEMSEHIVNAFDKRYNNDKEKCLNLLKTAKSEGLDYYKNFHACDEYNKKNAYWEFGLEELTNYYKKDILDEIGDLLDKFKIALKDE